jgi:hypothetical protein
MRPAVYFTEGEKHIAYLLSLSAAGYLTILPDAVYCNGFRQLQLCYRLKE